MFNNGDCAHFVEVKLYIRLFNANRILIYLKPSFIWRELCKLTKTASRVEETPRYNYFYLRGTYAIAREKTLSKLFYLSCPKASTIKENYLLPRHKHFTFKVNSISKGGWCTEKQTESQKLTSLCKLAKQLPTVSIPLKTHEFMYDFMYDATHAYSQKLKFWKIKRTYHIWNLRQRYSKFNCHNFGSVVHRTWSWVITSEKFFK